MLEYAEFSECGPVFEFLYVSAENVRACGRKEPPKEWNQESGSFRTLQ